MKISIFKVLKKTTKNYFMNNPLVSIIVPCYNQAQYVQETLQSVLEQTYRNWECIIVNDGSIDNTEVIANQWIEKDNRFKYFYQENQGLSSARNLGLEKMNGEFVQFLDSDDIIDVEKIEKSLSYIYKEHYDLVISNFRTFSLNVADSDLPFCALKKEYFDLDNILNNWDIAFSIPIHCGFFKSSFFETFSFPIQLKAKEDWIMWINIFRKKPNCFFLDSPLSFYRRHSGSMTFNRDFMNNNLIKALEFINEITTKDEYNKILLIRLNRTLDEVNDFEIKYREVKDSNSFKLGNKIKNLFMQFHLEFIYKQILKIYK